METAFDKILIPIDFSINSLNAIKQACDMADEHALLHLLHVQSYGYPLLSFSAARFLKPDIENDYQKAEKKLDELRQWVTERFPKVVVTTHIDTKRDVPQGIIHAAKSTGATLIVIATKSRHRWFSFLKTVKADKIQIRTSVPVMIVRNYIPGREWKSILVPVDNNVNEHKIKVIKCLCAKYDAIIDLVKFANEDITDENISTTVRLQYLQRIKMRLRCSVKWQFAGGRHNAKSIKKFAENFHASLIVLETGKESRMNKLNGQIFDYINQSSPINIILTNGIDRL